MNVLAIFGLVIGVLLIVVGIAKPSMLASIGPQKFTQDQLRVSAIIIGAIFVGLALLTLSGTLKIPM